MEDGRRKLEVGRLKTEVGWRGFVIRALFLDIYVGLQIRSS
jgi:hypothetical protein